jgi:hypothetical protein
VPVCNSCRTKEAVYHITHIAEIFGPGRPRVKNANFWLCESCEYGSREILQRDGLQRQRLAFRFCDNPSFMTERAGWRPIR